MNIEDKERARKILELFKFYQDETQAMGAVAAKLVIAHVLDEKMKGVKDTVLILTDAVKRIY